MSEHFNVVHKQAIKLDAEEWSKGIKMIHIHSLESSWYETAESVKDIQNGSVCDTMFNDGRIERRQNNKLIRVFGKALKGDRLIDEYNRYSHHGENIKNVSRKF